MAEAVMNYYKADDLGGLYKMITKIIKVSFLIAHFYMTLRLFCKQS